MRTSPSLPFWSAFLGLLGVVVRQPPLDAPQPTEPILVPEATAVEVQKLAYCGCTDREIAARYQIDEAVIRTRFAPELSTARAMRSFALRKAQFDLARDGNGPMLTWLGRNELGQTLNPATPGVPEPDMESKAG